MHDRRARVFLPIALLFAGSEVSAQQTHAYNCLLELRAIDDHADEAIRRLSAETIRLRSEIPADRNMDALNLASEAKRASILAQQHAALNAVRSRCYPHREGEQ
jgi:hypothetical protein